MVERISVRLRKETSKPIIVPERNYSPRGAAAELFHTRDPVILSGPAETGKTLSTLHYLDALAWRYPGMQAAIVRKTQKSLLGSVIQTYEKEVLVPGDGVTKYGGEKPEWFDYPNGSRVWLGGMDNADKVLSTARDLIVINQAEELSLEDYEVLTTRASGRAGNMPWGQVVGDCNPGAPTHWILSLSVEGKLKLLESRHKDNPVLFDAEKDEWTQRGLQSLAVLGRLTGVRRDRLFLGKWAAAEGIVYEIFDRARHMAITELDFEPRYIFASVDWGFTNPGVIQVWALDGDKRMYRIAEIYRTNEIIDWWIEQAVKLKKEFGVKVFVCDPAEPGFIKQFRIAGLVAVPAFNDIKVGIQNVISRLEVAGDGRPRMYFLPNVLRERDEELAKEHKPTCAEEEIDAYVWEKSKDGKPVKEKPVDKDNHAMDTTRYAAAYVDGFVRKGGGSTDAWVSV